MTDIHNRKGWFKGMPRATCDALRDAVLDVLDEHRPTLIFTVLDKQGHVAKYGMRAKPPEDYTYMLMIERFNHFLGRRGEIGLIVSDDQKGSEDTIRKAHSSYRKSGTTFTQIQHVIETPFFAPSHWSRMLQVVDVATWLLNRGMRNQAEGLPEPPQMQRLEQHLDGYPNYMGKGIKVVP